jgi:hypothetical protein
MTTTANAVHMVGTRICVAPDCEEAGTLVEFHSQRTEGHALTQVTLRWRCRARHAWQETYAHGKGPTTIEIEQVR